jgi:hypothetical protein
MCCTKTKNKKNKNPGEDRLGSIERSIDRSTAPIGYEVVEWLGSIDFSVLDLSRLPTAQHKLDVSVFSSFPPFFVLNECNEKAMYVLA